MTAVNDSPTLSVRDEDKRITASVACPACYGRTRADRSKRPVREGVAARLWRICRDCGRRWMVTILPADTPR